MADLLTKALGYKQFSELISKIGLINIYSPSVHPEGECQSSSAAATCAQSPNSAATCVSGVTLMQPTLMQPQLHHNAVDNATCASGITLMQPTLMQPPLHHNAVDNAAATEQPRLHQTKQEF